MDRQPIVIAPADRPRPLTVVGEQVTVLAPGSQTGSYEVFHQAGPEGTGPPPHNHPWDESLFVMRGTVHFCVDDRQETLSPGTFVHIPGGT
ncbi:MAG: cupin domain-containing protein, partial [Acidimicrobiales bacterium]